MKISKTMLKGYLRYVTLTYVNMHDNPPDDFSEYDGGIRELRIKAERDGDLSWIKLGLDYILTTPGVNIREYSGGQYPYSAEQLHDLFRYTWDKLWPDERLSPLGEATAIDLVEMPGEEWDALRDSMTPSVK